MRVTANQLVAGVLIFTLFYIMYIGLYIMMDYITSIN